MNDSADLPSRIATLSTNEQRFLCTCLLRLQDCPPELAAELPGFVANLPELCGSLYQRYNSDPDASEAGFKRLEPEQALQLVQLFSRILGRSATSDGFSFEEFLNQNADLAADFPLMSDAEKARYMRERLQREPHNDPGFSPDQQKKS